MHKDKVCASTTDPGGREESSSITVIISRFWSTNLVPWITFCLWRSSTCQSALRRCGVAFLLKNTRRGKGQESSSGCCGCWKITYIREGSGGRWKSSLDSGSQPGCVMQFLLRRFSWEHPPSCLMAVSTSVWSKWQNQTYPSTALWLSQGGAS